MKRLFIVLAVFAVALTSCGQKAAEVQLNENGEPIRAKGAKITTQSDSVSYALGVEYANYLVRMKETIGPDFNEKMVIAAIKDILNNKESLNSMDAFGVMQNYFSIVLPERNRVEGEKFLADVEKNNPNVKKTESGLLYEIITPGSEKKATMADEVRVMYKGTTKNDKEFDSSYKRNDTTQFPLSRVIPGWGEGMQLVGEGGKIKLWIPAELGYGERGIPGSIGPNEPLMFEVEMVEVLPAAADPATETPAATPAK